METTEFELIFKYKSYQSIMYNHSQGLLSIVFTQI
jgi:hypothetical protein